MKSNHLTLALTYQLGNHTTIIVEAYNQWLKNIPVAYTSDYHYWMLNDVVGYSKYALQSVGSGKNYGIDLSIEKSFDDGFFVLGTGSLYRAKYSIDGQSYYNSRYDGKFNSSLVAGKEFYFAEGDLLQLGFRNLWYGGQRFGPDNASVTSSTLEYIEDPKKQLSEKNRNYWRSDVRISYKKNLSTKSWTLSLDIQNVLNRKNTRGVFWHTGLNSYQDKLQAGIIPVISFQIDF